MGTASVRATPQTQGRLGRKNAADSPPERGLGRSPNGGLGAVIPSNILAVKPPRSLGAPNDSIKPTG